MWILLGLEEIPKHPYEGGFEKWKLCVDFGLEEVLKLPYEGGFVEVETLVWFETRDIILKGRFVKFDVLCLGLECLTSLKKTR